MKITVMTDMEGVAGVVSFEDQAFATGKYYEQAKRLLTGEVNAAVEGLAEAGADDILVIDGHGDGGIVYEELHPAARLLHGRPFAPWRTTLDELTTGRDAAILIGQHAMAGTLDGNLHHTMSSQTVEYYKLNGKEVGETALFVLYQGALGVPLVFLSGDAAACREVEELVPGVVTAAVKQGLTRTCAVSLPVEASRKLIRQGVQKALRAHARRPIAPLKWPGPYVLEKRFLSPEPADWAMQGDVGAERVDELTVRYRSEDICSVLYA